MEQKNVPVALDDEQIEEVSGGVMITNANLRETNSMSLRGVDAASLRSVDAASLRAGQNAVVSNSVQANKVTAVQ